MVRAPLRILRFVGQAALVVLALGVLGSFFPAILLLGELGPVINSYLGPWIAILSFVGAVFCLLRWRKHRRRRTMVLAGVAMLAALGAGYIQIAQIGVAAANGVRIDFAQALLPRSQKDDTLRPVTMIYGKDGTRGLPLDIYRAAGKDRATPAPVLVYIHGGGWGAETLKQRQADYRWFAERGYLVISLEYALSSEQRHTWDIAQPQLACALAWVGANAARYGGDRSRLALWGESAGGNLALNLSYMANRGTLGPPCSRDVPKVAATIALYPVVDPARMYRNDNMLIGVFGRMMTVNYTGGTPEQFPDRYAAIATASHISAAAPATLLIIPEADHLVVPQAAYGFARRAASAGVRTQVIQMPYAEHSFDLRSGSIGNQLVRRSMLKFLNENDLGAAVE